MKTIRFHNVKQTLLAKAVFLLKEIMLRIRSGYVPPDYPFACGRGLDILCELLFHGRVVGTT